MVNYDNSSAFCTTENIAADEMVDVVGGRDWLRVVAIGAGTVAGATAGALISGGGLSFGGAVAGAYLAGLAYDAVSSGR